MTNTPAVINPHWVHTVAGYLKINLESLLKLCYIRNTICILILTRRLRRSLDCAPRSGIDVTDVFARASTQRGCKVFSPDFSGIEFSRVEITGVDLSVMTVLWYDGVIGPVALLLFAITFCLVAAGLFLLVKPMVHQTK